VPLAPISDTQFVLIGGGANIEFVKDAKGAVTQLTFRSVEGEARAVRKRRAEANALVWNDAMTGRQSRSLGAAEYRALLSAVGLSVISEYEDEGQNYYFDAVKDRVTV
jgi:hypothetical protein